MRVMWFFLALVFAAGVARGEDPQAVLDQLHDREESPVFRRAVVAYQTVKEMYENAYKLPSVEPLAEVVNGYGAMAEKLAEEEPLVAAVALDRVMQIGFVLGERGRFLEKLREFEEKYPAVTAGLPTLGNMPGETVFGNGKIEVRGLEVGELQDDEIVRIAFEVRSLSGKAERLALDLRVMNDDPRVKGVIRNFQSSHFFAVPAAGWKRHEITLRQIFAAQLPEEDHAGYRVLPGNSVVRATFGTVPDWYEDSAHTDVAFENQFYQRYYVRRPRD